jgi:type VI secretion system protein
MPYLKLKLISGSVVDQNDDCFFTDLGGSIGRAKDCDWTLIDADRFISKKHLLISFRDQQFILTDVSSNGVVINTAGAPLGRDNEYVLQTLDTLVIGKHSIQVDEINHQISNHTTQQENKAMDGDLLGLVMGAQAQPAPENDLQSLFTSSAKPNFSENDRPPGDLGLDDILSKPLKSSAPNEYTPQQNSEPFKPKNEVNTPFSPAFDNVTKAVDNVIPDDWDMFDVSDALPVTETQELTSAGDSANPFVKEPETPRFEPTTSEPEWPSAAPSQDVLNKGAQVAAPAPAPVSEFVDINKEPFVTEPPVIQTPVEAVTAQRTNETALVSAKDRLAVGDDAFFTTLYQKLGLPKELITTIDKETFADDIATVLLSTTQGVMSLLASRTAFKQESRLSATLIKPRSNNPIKFSIDPVDTLEMLLVKKKKGYMEAGEAFDEALKDIQLHQMAFMSGLQGTLVGLLSELDPETIEKKVNDKPKRFMGLNSNSQYWQVYKEKQQSLARNVSENLNEILGSYFSEAYQAQINSFNNLKNEK